MSRPPGGVPYSANTGSKSLPLGYLLTLDRKISYYSPSSLPWREEVRGRGIQFDPLARQAQDRLCPLLSSERGFIPNHGKCGRSPVPVCCHRTAAVVQWRWTYASIFGSGAGAKREMKHAKGITLGDG